MKKYEKLYTRENGILAFQVWHQNQTVVWKKTMGWAAPTYLLNSTDGVVEVYYEPTFFPEAERRIAGMLKNKKFLQDLLTRYDGELSKLEKIWKARKPLKDRQALIDYFNLSVSAWSGQAMCYFIPTLPKGFATEAQKKTAYSMRERGGTFFEDMDRIFKLTMRKLFPALGELASYIMIEEILAKKIPSRKVLLERKKHFIYYDGKLSTGITFDAFIKKYGIKVDKIIIANRSELKGQIAMKGLVRGPVHLVLKKEFIKDVKAGEILVTTMTTPDYLPAMYKAAAFVTDEGGVTCHAAIVAREMKKPCVIGTLTATQVLKNGDMVEVDANHGTVKIIKK